MGIGTAAGIGMSLIATEHFFSAGLSSPITTRKFLTTENDKREVQRAVMLAVLFSVAAGALLSAILKQPWPLVASVALAAFYYNEYRRALS